MQGHSGFDIDRANRAHPIPVVELEMDRVGFRCARWVSGFMRRAPASPVDHDPPGFTVVDKPTAVRELWRMDATASPAQGLVSPRWDAVDFMVDFHSREKRLGPLMEAFGWITAVAFFRLAESETHYLAQPTELDRRYHRSILATLIGEGERLLTRILVAGGLPRNFEDIKSEDIDATLEELRNTQVQWYGDMTAGRRAQILKEVFDVPPG